MSLSDVGGWKQPQVSGSSNSFQKSQKTSFSPCVVVVVVFLLFLLRWYDSVTLNNVSETGRLTAVCQAETVPPQALQTFRQMRPTVDTQNTPLFFLLFFAVMPVHSNAMVAR